MKYTIGIDYGTLTSRAELVAIETSSVVAKYEMAYPHGLMEHALPSGKPLGPHWALQNGIDYYDMLIASIRQLLLQSRVSRKDVIGIGVDTTACTILPLGNDLEPLNSQPEFCDEPNAYVKLWKHHAAQKYADQLNEIALAHKMPFLDRYGGKISSEWMIPKIMQIVDESPAVYDATSCFLEIGDWLVYKMTGKIQKSNTMAGYKSLWSDVDGFPDKEFFKALNPKMENIVDEKLSQPILPIGTKVGTLTDVFAIKVGLPKETAVAIAHTDAGVVPYAIGMGKVGQMVMSIGTSTCHFLLGDSFRIVPGMCGVVKDGALPGFYTYEAGQAAVGDIFQWFVANYTDASLAEEAKNKNLSIFQLLGKKAQELQIGENGLVLLDWLNGNRSILVDTNLSGVLIGLNLHTKPEEIYRALLEGTAFGTRKIIETLEDNGVAVTELFACGGIPRKDSFMMQIYADVCNKPIYVPHEDLAAAYGDAVHAAAIAGKKNGGFDSSAEAIEAMGCQKRDTYLPIPEHVVKYDELFFLYEELHEFFGNSSKILRRLNGIRTKCMMKKDREKCDGNA